MISLSREEQALSKLLKVKLFPRSQGWDMLAMLIAFKFLQAGGTRVNALRRNKALADPHFICSESGQESEGSLLNPS